MESDFYYMEKALDLARQGQGHVHPNPLVGALLLKDNKIIGQGFHANYGGPHAEIRALESAIGSPEGSTMYVNLEPCTYHGKTPPCTPAIIEAGVERVIIGMRDPNPMVDGMGIRQLREAGVDVVVGIMEAEARELNRGFAHQIEYGIPWVTLKLALTIDGFMADTGNTSKWITNEESRKEVHRLRAEHNAILVGGGTVKVDDPRLTVRAVEGTNPLRIVLDPERIAPADARIFSSGEAETIVVTDNKTSDGESFNNDFVDVMTLGKNSVRLFEWKDILKGLHDEKGILSVFVEGGAEVASSLMESGCVDELIVMTGPRIIGTGLSPFHKCTLPMEDAILWRIHALRQLGDDVYVRYRRREGM